jgi:drug/metabolite transporter (DMT)-like permease
MAEKRKIWHWIVIAILSLIWGTSYILMKKGLESFSSLQIGSLRILITGVFLGLLGAVGLLYAGSFSFNYYGLLIILATILYGISSNEVSVVALALFYLLIRDTSPAFGSTVTYFVPIISTLWGLADNESLMLSMFILIAVILTGVYIINRPALKKYIKSLNE